MTTAAFRNKATLTYSIAFFGHPDMEGKFERHSHSLPEGDNYYQDLPEPTGSVFARENAYQHGKDAERQVINLLADKIYDHLRCTSTDDYTTRIRTVRGGTLDLYSDMGPCHSCRSVIAAFRKDFPALTVTVRYRNAVRGGRSAALMEAGGGLYGAYGIGDATQGRDELWSKTYPGVPVFGVTGTFAVQHAKGRYTGSVTTADERPYSSYLYPVPGENSAERDAVTAVLDLIARGLGTQLSPRTPLDPPVFRRAVQGASGTVRLDCDRGIVQQGRKSVAAFQRDFPKVSVEVAFPGTGPMVDGRGYTDALRQTDGTWLKSFPAAT
ncbi:deaminase domain-containing protein [Streptomyces sp. NPDC096079]|uniref:deaminase domain-containing protein n=1 Tax=unclassified Streptomyces TaxID=2593676 RepID=UPI0033347CA7